MKSSGIWTSGSNPLTEQERQAFLAGLHIAVLSAASDGARPPLTIPIWSAYSAAFPVGALAAVDGELPGVEAAHP
jgi:hypothetical protein